MDFRRLLAELDAFHDDCAETVAAGIVNKVFEWAAHNGFPMLVRGSTPAAQVVEVRRHLAAAIAATRIEETESDAMIDLATAAELVGYKPAGLRKIVAAVKAGKSGPTIRFAQVGKGPIRFRREWLEDFINGNVVSRPEKLRAKTTAKPMIEPQHGFDNRFFKR